MNKLVDLTCAVSQITDTLEMLSEYRDQELSKSRIVADEILVAIKVCEQRKYKLMRDMARIAVERWGSERDKAQLP